MTTEETVWQQPETWVAVSFLLFVVLFVRYALVPITKMLDARGERIRQELAAAQQLRAEAEAVLRSYKQKEIEALAEAEALLKHAREEADLMKTQAATDMKAAIDRRVAQANEKIERAESQAIDSIRGQIVDLAVAAARQAVADKLGEGTDPAVTDAIKNAGRIVH